jgi:hypothetical protein
MVFISGGIDAASNLMLQDEYTIALMTIIKLSSFFNIIDPIL